MTDDPRSMPTLLLLRNLLPDLPGFLRAHFSERVRCLEQSFRVVVHDGPGDLGKICDDHQPDLLFFELGADSIWPGLTNVTANPSVPRLGFVHADAFDLARAAFVSAAEVLGIDTYFTHSVSMGEYCPEFADRLFYWPNFVDWKIFHPYGAEKVEDVLFTGSHVALYPWRNRNRWLLEQHFQYSELKHLGWDGAGANRMPFGEQYARILARSRFVPSCGSISRDVVRKHLEVPAVGTCLVAEPTESLRAFGFKDMQNCVLGDGRDLVDKMNELMQDEAAYERVTRAGSELVRHRHTMERRQQVFQWYELATGRGPLDRIDQDGPAGDLYLRPESEASGQRRNRIVVSHGVDRKLLLTAWALFRSGDVNSAAANFDRCLEFTYMPEAVVGLTYCHLMRGRESAAEATLTVLWESMAKRYGDLLPDPVVSALMIRLRLCQGDLEDAHRLAAQSSRGHRELDRIRELVLDLGTEDESTGEGRRVPSVCAPPTLARPEWTAELVSMLNACGQADLAREARLGHLSADRSQVSRLNFWLRQASRAGRRGVRSGMDRSRRVARRLGRPMKKRWMATDWGEAVTAAVNRRLPATALIVGPRRWSRRETVFRWAIRSTGAELLVVGAAPGLPRVEPTPNAEFVYVSRIATQLLPAVVQSPRIVARTVILERPPGRKGGLIVDGIASRFGVSVVFDQPGRRGGITVFEIAVDDSLVRPD